MNVESDVQRRSQQELRAFREQVEGLGLWDGAWLSLMAVRSSSGWVCFVLRSILTAPGCVVPSADAVFDVTADDVRVRVRKMELADLWSLLAELADGVTMKLAALFGEPLAIPEGKSPSLFQFSKSHSRRSRQHLLLLRNPVASFHEIFGYDLFDKLGAQLRTHQPPYSGTKEVVENMSTIWGASFDQNNSNPVFEISAELPIDPVSAVYNPAFKGIELRTSVGRTVPLSRLTVSITPAPRCRLFGTDFVRKPSGDSVVLTHVVPSDQPTGDVSVDLLFDDISINTTRIRAATESLSFVSDDGRGQGIAPWRDALERDFHWTLSALRRRLRKALPRRVADVAEARIADSIRMREGFPFFALVSAASVAEVLLKERLVKVRKGSRSKAWAAARAKNNKLSKKLPNDLTFDQCIRVAAELGLLDDIDSQSVDLLRVARNEVHLSRTSRPSHEDFSPVRASAAILATLKLCTVSNRRPKLRTPVAVPTGTASPVAP